MGIPSVKKTDSGTSTVGGSALPESGLYEITFGEWAKSRPLFRGGTTPPLGNGKWLVGVSYPGDFTEYLMYNLTVNDDGSVREELKQQVLRNSNDGKTKYDFFTEMLNTLCESAGVEDIADLPGKAGYAMWQKPVPGAVDGKGKKLYGKTTILTADNYNKLVDSGFTVQDLQGVRQAPAQQDREEAPARTVTASRRPPQPSV